MKENPKKARNACSRGPRTSDITDNSVVNTQTHPTNRDTVSSEKTFRTNWFGERNTQMTEKKSNKVIVSCI